MYESANSAANWAELWWWDGSFQVWGPSTPPPNQPPALFNNDVTPTSGGTSTNFYYYVHYYDADGDSPSVKDVYIDYRAHAMSLYLGSSANGIYRYGPVNLDCRTTLITYHRYSFNFDDGKGHTTCLPASCSAFIRGPDATITLGEAIDNTVLSWSTGGSASWFGQCSERYWDNDAAQSGVINHSQSTWLETTVNAPGHLSFYWKVYSEPVWDCLKFYIDNVLRAQISGLTDWQSRAYYFSSGTHTLKWVYEKDGSVNSGHDRGWLDKVEFTTPPGSYVSTDGCGGLTPCYSTIQAAVNAASDGSIIQVGQGTYNEAPVWNAAGTVTIRGGWNGTFTQQTGTTEMYEPRATGGGTMKVLPNTRVVAPQ